MGTLPGTAAEILDDEVRRLICPDKLSTQEWLQIVEAAHRVGFTTTATIMFGHVDRYQHWARHLLRIRALQARTHGFTEFVPLPFVHMEAPMYIQGKARKGPTYRETVLMHAVARLALHPLIPNVQVSWVKLGPQGVRACLMAGANDLGGTLMNESISRAAGTCHGQEMPPPAHGRADCVLRTRAAATHHAVRGCAGRPKRALLRGAAARTRWCRRPPASGHASGPEATTGSGGVALTAAELHTIEGSIHGLRLQHSHARRRSRTAKASSRSPSAVKSSASPTSRFRIISSSRARSTRPIRTTRRARWWAPRMAIAWSSSR